jgi:hypothetical protein
MFMRAARRMTRGYVAFLNACRVVLPLMKNSVGVWFHQRVTVLFFFSCVLYNIANICPDADQVMDEDPRDRWK